ncbi:hypothetical protein T06_15898 [Trichinella sp. T6]|nr:hypothetical protein T06_15898 [Trichinella sp. T6]
MDLPPINVNKSTPDSRDRSKSLRPPGLKKRSMLVHLHFTNLLKRKEK